MNKYEKHKKTVWTKQDEFNAYFKMAMIILAGYLYFHFIIMGW